MAGSFHSTDSTVALSRRQKLFWLDGRLFPTARYHNLLLTIELDGRLDVGRLQRAWRQTAAELDALKIAVDAQSPVERWLDLDEAPLSMVDTGPDVQEMASQTAALCNWQPASNEPMWRVSLLRRGSQRHVFCLCQHHMITDGFSMLVLAKRLAAHYGDPDSILPRHPGPSFRSYLEDEARYASSERGRRDQAYWDEKLRGGTPPLRLYGIPRTRRSVAVERHSEHAPPGQAHALEMICKTEPFTTLSPSVSRLVVLATGWVAFLYRATGNREILVGVPFANRSAAFAHTYGLLMEQIFLRADVDEGATFAQLAHRVRDDLIRSFRHGRACISDHGLDYATLSLVPYPHILFGDLAANVRLSPGPTFLGEAAGEGDLRDTIGLEVQSSGQSELLTHLDLHAATFDAKVRKRIRSHFGRIMNALLANPHARIDAVDLMDEEERRAVLSMAAGANPNSPAPDVVDSIAQHVRNTPERTAVVAPEGTLRYADLESASNRLARCLRDLGVDRDVCVGVSLSRGARELVALLAILKAGGAYVPLDPTHPIDRLQLILQEAAPRVLLFDTSSPFANPSVRSILGLNLERLDEIAPDADDAPLGLAYGRSDLAYVLFTSGSTGKPKGVEVSRGAFSNFLRSMAHTPGLSSDDRVIAITTTAFDIAGLELFLPLWVGASVHIADRATAQTPKHLRALLEREPITFMQATPATWRLLLDAGWKGNGQIRLLCGGEALSADLAARLVHCGRELWNVYGPTETTVWSSLERIKPTFDRITIGRPIDATQMYAIDSAGHLAPPGILGELCIGGQGLARGYHGQPGLTTERFVRNPYGRDGDLLYRTGDLARLLDDGRFECLGRIDHQLKIRGFRIEPGEIEMVLRTTPGVREALIAAQSNDGQEPSLVAYWVGEATREALHEHAQRKLPAYMIPSYYVRLESFPLNTHGKIDRKRLPKPQQHLTDGSTSPLTRPRNDAEARVAAIWADVLRVPDVGIDQDFFTIGGSSTLAIEVQARIEGELGIDLPLGLLFEHPTIRGLLAHLDGGRTKDQAIVVWLRRGPPDVPPLHCLLGVQLYQDIALAMHGERSVIGMHVPIRYDPAKERRPTVRHVASRYVELIRREQPNGPYHLAGLCYGGIVAFEAARQLEQMHERVEVVAIFDGKLPSAYSVNTLARLGGLVGSSLRNPGRALEKIRERGQALAKRLVPLATGRSLFANGLGAHPPSEPIELPIDGPEVDEEARKYASTVGPLASRLVVFRAVEEEKTMPPWLNIAPDLGWAGLASEVSVHPIDAAHLALVRDPHARTVATILAHMPEAKTQS